MSSAESPNTDKLNVIEEKTADNNDINLHEVNDGNKKYNFSIISNSNKL